MNSILTNQAPEVLAVRSAELQFNLIGSVENLRVLETAEKIMFAALKASAEMAINMRAKLTDAQHDSADINAYDTVAEAGVDPESDEGRLIYNRMYHGDGQSFL